jgi:hypothetical protein
MWASIYMTLSYKIEKIGIHSVLGKISGHEAGGRKKLFPKIKK